MDPVAAGTIWTIGHSTRSLEEFIGLLQENGVEAVADIRRFPGSRKFPQFNADALAESLPAAGIEYVPMQALGGRRKPDKDSRNTVWRNDAFRAYADFMETPAFETALEDLMAFAHTKRTALMCSEAVWWRCHRSMVSDALKARGWTVLHIMGPGKTTEHPYTAAAHRVDGKLDYGPPRDLLA